MGKLMCQVVLEVKMHLNLCVTLKHQVKPPENTLTIRTRLQLPTLSVLGVRGELKQSIGSSQAISHHYL